MMDKMKLLTTKRYVILIALLCSLLWGSAFPVLKISYEELGLEISDIYGKLVFAGMRFFLASILLFILLLVILKKSIKVEKKILLELFFLGVLQTGLQYFFFYNGLAYTTGMKGAILSSSGTFFVVILAHFVYTDDKMDWRKIVGLISGFLGIFLVNWGKGGLNLNVTFRGEGFLILAGLISAFGTLLAKRLSKGVHPFLVTAWQMFLGSSLLILVGLSGLEEGAISFTPKAWGLLFYSALLSAIAFALWYSLLKYNRAGEITLYKFMIPVSGAFLSAVFLPKEQFTLFMLSGLILVAFGVIAVNYRKGFNVKK